MRPDLVGDREPARLEERQLAALVESAGDAMISTDTDGVIATWNAAAERLYGHAAREAEGQPLALVVPPGRRDEFSRALQAVKEGTRVEHFETVVRRKDGSLLDVSVGASPLKDGSGRVLGACWISHRLSRPKRPETVPTRVPLPPKAPAPVPLAAPPGPAAPWLTLEQVGQAVVVKFARPDLEDLLVVEAVGAALTRLADETGGSRVILDFEGVSRLGSAMLGKFIAFHRKVGKAGGQVVICTLPSEVFQKFSATNLDKILHVYPDRQQALTAVQG